VHSHYIHHWPSIDHLKRINKMSKTGQKSSRSTRKDSRGVLLKEPHTMKTDINSEDYC